MLEIFGLFVLFIFAVPNLYMASPQWFLLGFIFSVAFFVPAFAAMIASDKKAQKEALLTRVNWFLAFFILLYFSIAGIFIFHDSLIAFPGFGYHGVTKGTILFLEMVQAVVTLILAGSAFAMWAYHRFNRKA